MRSNSKERLTPTFVSELGLENITPDDVVWTGDRGDIDADALLAKQGYDPFSPLEVLLLAIIRANPSGAKSETDRLASAVEALTGKPGQSGPRERDDYEVLLQVAWKYHEATFNSQTPTLTKLVRDAMTACCPLADHQRKPDREDDAVRRILRKFKRDKDILLARVTSEMNDDRMDVIRLVREAARLLALSGVTLRLDAIRAKVRGRT